MDAKRPPKPRSVDVGNNVDGRSADPFHEFFPDHHLVAHALENARIGVWEWDFTSQKIAWSSNLESIHDLAPGRFNGTFSFFENDIHPDDRKVVAAAIENSLKTGAPYSVVYRLPPKTNSIDRWISASGSVVMENGMPKKMFGICRDVTEQMVSENELRMRAQRQEILARLGQQALVENDLQKLFNEVTRIVATLLEVDLVNVLELTPGDAELLFRAGYGWKPGTIENMHVIVKPGTQANYTLTAGTPLVVTDLLSETRFTPAPILLDHGVVSSMSTTITGNDNRIYGIFSIHTRQRRIFDEYDVSLLSSVANIISSALQLRQLDQRQKLMIRELHHRAGNFFSQLLALFSQTAASSRNMAELKSKYEARVFALANAHRIIVEGGWQPASLVDLLHTQLAAYLDQMSLSGPNVFLEPAPAFAVSTAMHELGSNAIQHGSLAAPGGHVDLKWSVKRTEHGMILNLDWYESGGPAPKRSRKRGFGLRLVDMVIERQLNGEIHRSFPASGMKCHLVIPLARERWPSEIDADEPLPNVSDPQLS